MRIYGHTKCEFFGEIPRRLCLGDSRKIVNSLFKRGIKPEDLSPEEDVKKLERRVKNEEKKFIENPDKLKKDRRPK